MAGKVGRRHTIMDYDIIGIQRMYTIVTKEAGVTSAREEFDTAREVVYMVDPLIHLHRVDGPLVGGHGCATGVSLRERERVWRRTRGDLLQYTVP